MTIPPERVVTLAERIEALLEKRGKSARAASMETGRGPDVIRNILRAAQEGKPYNPRRDTIQLLASVLKVPAEYLFAPDDDIKLVSSFDPDAAARNDEDFDPDKPATPADFPRGAMVELAAHGGLGSGQVIQVSYHRQGEEILAQDEIKPDYWHFPSDFARMILGAPPEKMVVIECVGDSMEPTIMSGERVWVNTQHKRPTPDGIYAIRDALNAIVIKRLELIVNSSPPRVRIISDNPKHTPQEVGLDDIAIIGKVKCGLRMF